MVLAVDLVVVPAPDLVVAKVEPKDAVVVGLTGEARVEVGLVGRGTQMPA